MIDIVDLPVTPGLGKQLESAPPPWTAGFTFFGKGDVPHTFVLLTQPHCEVKPYSFRPTITYVCFVNLYYNV